MKPHWKQLRNTAVYDVPLGLLGVAVHAACHGQMHFRFRPAWHVADIGDRILVLMDAKHAFALGVGSRDAWDLQDAIASAADRSAQWVGGGTMSRNATGCETRANTARIVDVAPAEHQHLRREVRVGTGRQRVRNRCCLLLGSWCNMNYGGQRSFEVNPTAVSAYLTAEQCREVAAALLNAANVLEYLQEEGNG